MEVCGGGVARQLANRYKAIIAIKNLEEEYRQYCSNYNNEYEKLKGTVLFITVEDKIISNLFSQKPNFDTDYEVMRKGLEQIKEVAKKNNLSIAIPYGIGCGIANGNWNEVYKIVDEVFSNYKVTLYRLEQ